MTRLKRKPVGAYHHPDLETALVDAAVRTIADEGLEALTLRGVGARLGVSRTALYRHFEDKAALLARVALEGFRRFRAALEEAVTSARAAGRDAMEEMGVAYVGFALANPSHYATMFSDACRDWSRYPELESEAEGAFMVLVNTIVEEQKARRMAVGDPQKIAEVIWSGVHGQAMLTIAGHLEKEEFEETARFSWRWRVKARG